MPSAPPGDRQAPKAVQARIRQGAADEPIAARYLGARRNPPVELLLTDGHLAAINAAETAIAADERFEHQAPATGLIRQFAADRAADHQADHVNAFMVRHRRIASTRVCYFASPAL